ncbi:hypothetical protein FH972_027327 [Carpinus fangiana]|nr:hypothetical protein FH972_027327 [Carpinus fangiana]
MLVDIPGLPPLPASDMMKSMSDRSAKVYENFLNTATHMAKSNGLIVNTFDLLERKALGALRDGKCVPDGPTPPIFCIGPSISSSNIQDGENQHECLNWLNLQPSQSVVFLCFGSMGSFSAKQLQEIAVGLENSGQRAVLAKELKVALAVNESEDGLVSAAELEKRVRELMVSEAGKEVREKVSAMRDAAMAAVEEGGSAQVALAELAQSWVTTTC